MSGAFRSAPDGGGRAGAEDRLHASAARAGASRDSAEPVRSPEVSAAVILLAGIGAAALTGPAIAAAGGELLRLCFGRVAAADDAAALAGLLPAALGHAGRLAAPLLAAAIAGAVAGHLVQQGLPIRLRSVTPRWHRIAPSWGRVGRRLWSADTAIGLGRELLKVGAVAVVAALNIGAALRAIAAGAPTAEVAYGAALRLAVQAAVVLLLLAAADYLVRYFRARRRAHRSVAQEREERRLQEGDPMVRDRLRARTRALLVRTAAEQVAAADVVCADAARTVVALRWDPDTMTAPVVVAKAAAESARRMREAAESSGVAVIERAALSGVLFRRVALGDPIPRSYEPAVAAILAAHGTARRDRRPRGGGARPGGARWPQ
ncbi:MAG: EscU/YscU/HrcU family type III secretion system export apparatus switch protein [Spirochaetaceae bacterium]|nr:EscU/YscU/HrcU family type III secretion system export apparatus switch protein [Spirochaetaceae bacterium]